MTDANIYLQMMADAATGECKSCHEIGVLNSNKICHKCYTAYLEGCDQRHEGRAKKEPIPSEIRWAVWDRDNFTCQRCGTRKNLSVDHIHPESKGGKATVENCQTLCKSCNSSKGDRT